MVDKNLNDFTKEDLVEYQYYLGLCQFGPGEDSAAVMIFKEASGRYFYSVVLHELGHLLGIQHLPGDAVMNRIVSSRGCLRLEDVEALCRLYRCKPHPECRTEAAVEMR